MNCDPNGTSSSGWLECGKRDCSGGAQDEKQVFCVLCRKWFHLKCRAKCADINETYFCCCSE